MKRDESRRLLTVRGFQILSSPSWPGDMSRVSKPAGYQVVHVIGGCDQVGSTCIDGLRPGSKGGGLGVLSGWLLTSQTSGAFSFSLPVETLLELFLEAVFRLWRPGGCQQKE